jgi:hypothetical protein
MFPVVLSGSRLQLNVKRPVQQMTRGMRHTTANFSKSDVLRLWCGCAGMDQSWNEVSTTAAHRVSFVETV